MTLRGAVSKPIWWLGCGLCAVAACFLLLADFIENGKRNFRERDWL